jgi:hypothetical protein
MGLIRLTFSIVLSLAYLICGIYLIKLNNPARKAAIFLGVISIISMPFFFKPMLKQLNFDDICLRKKQMIIEQYKPEFQQKASDGLEKGKEFSKKWERLLL